MILAAAAGKVERAIARACTSTAIVLGIAIFLLMFAGIAGRHVFSDGLPAVTELPEQLFPWWVMVSVVMAAHAGGHVAVEALTARLEPRVKSALQAFAHALTVLLSGVVVWTTVSVALVSGGDRSPILGVPLLHLHTAVGLGFALVGVLSLCALARGNVPPA